jgi:ribosomal protein S18 acetylase RimI-like enzyme
MTYSLSRHPLDNPVWWALTSGNSDIAQGNARALRYPPDVAPFAATLAGAPDASAALAPLIPDGGRLLTVTAHEIAKARPGGEVLQMVTTKLTKAARAGAFEVLSEADAGEMQALVALTRPGPFAPRAFALGSYIGIRRGGRLAAMAGERMRPGEFVEISSVCVHPDHRGEGLANALVTTLAQAIIADGLMPFLHVFADNAPAIALYQRLGFEVRAKLVLSAHERVASAALAA